MKLDDTGDCTPKQFPMHLIAIFFYLTLNLKNDPFSANQGHRFEHRMKDVLGSCSTYHSL